MSLTTYYPNGLPYIVEERVDGIRKGTVYIYNVKRRLINELNYNRGDISYTAYWQNNLLHNLHGPAYVGWHNGQIFSISYLQNGIPHNLHGPVWIIWYYNGQIKYCQNDKQFIC